MKRNGSILTGGFMGKCRGGKTWMARKRVGTERGVTCALSVRNAANSHIIDAYHED